MEPSTIEVWTERVSAWRASGQRAESFSRREGYAASTLRWWASKLKREMAALPATASVPEMRLARVVRMPARAEPARANVSPGHAITLEVTSEGVRVGIEAGVDRATLAMVLEVLGIGGGQ